ncbi:hypothetical protein E2562_003925 [Oryza meyeriana var. granulata]|uniref:Rx N-terminal domain-containing protein n=1 Tax=Oryza meyeriana var. granulata TaxID=110450 RepID=A0A6G1CYY1_9ORYZ|nr:hypothetical protein E2562_003925 [Oryza meyeriana var. granulata]
MAVGGWFAQAVMENLVAKARSIMEEHHGLRATAGDMLYSIEATLPRIKILVDVTERKAFSNAKLDAWLRQFKDAVSEAKDLLDDFEIKRIQETMKKGRVSSAVSFGLKYLRNLFPSDTDLRRLEHVLRKLNSITSDGNAGFHDMLISAVDDEGVLPRRPTRPMQPVVVGRKEEKQQLLNMILFPRRDGAESSRGVSVISVVGAAGVGKTTLAQEMYNDPSVKEAFMLRGWVFASQVKTTSTFAETDTDQVLHLKLPTIKTKEPCAYPAATSLAESPFNANPTTTSHRATPSCPEATADFAIKEVDAARPKASQ